MLLSWRRWRRGRPFWGGLVTVVAGAEICAIPLAPVKVMLHQGIAGVSSVLLGVVLLVMGLSAWFAPHYRGLAGVLTVLAAAAALVLSNLGGFFVGTLLGICGGALIFAWQPLPGTGPAAVEHTEAVDGASAPEREAGVVLSKEPADSSSPPSEHADSLPPTGGEQP